MRYEDASGSFQASGPIANDDSDTLPAGSRQAATGNLITGEGTQYGSAGADSAVGGHITSIAGKGGEDSSFAGGKLSVTGEHGNLSVDAEGNYNYMANKGAPENVRDRFTYTLADSQGNTDTAALIIELGKTPVVIKADAQQVVPGPDGVVTLPPGVDLSDVMVVGRNLVINMPDGTQLIIVDGAIFVPQLVFDGVQVPATNVAALLIGQEPQPAAGELPPSSGGNFALPPPPLDPGVPLGDLIPPTVRDYIPPEPQDVFDELDDDPEVGPNPDVLRDDDALQGGNAGGVGDDPDAVNVTGQLSGSGGDGDLTFEVLLTGAPAGFTYVSGGAGVVLVQQGGVTVLTVTVNPDGSYSVVQNAPIDHAAGADENNVLFTINYTVTDEDGDSAAGTFTINVDDDTPLLTELIAQDGITLDESDFSIAGFPISDTSALPVVDFTALFGADGAAAVDSTVVALTITNANSGLRTAVGDFPITLVKVGDTIEGHYNGSNVAFVIVLNGDGTITLTQNVPLEHLVDGPPGPAHDDSLDLGGLVALSVTITDGDGDVATGQVGIGNLLVFRDDGPDAADPTGEPGTVVLDETRPEGTDTDDGSPVASPPDGLASATIDFSVNFGAPDFGADGAGTVTYQLVLSAQGIGSGLFALEAGDTTDGDGDGYGQGAEILLTLSGNTITGSAGGVDYFTISIDPATGVVTFTQLAAIWHPTPGDWDEIATLMTDLASDIQVQQTVTDSDGDFDTATIDIGHNVFSIQDDGPDPFEECPEDVITINQPGSEFTGSLNLPDVGEDEPGVVTFNVTDGDPVLDNALNPVVSGGVPLFYFINDQGVLEARAGDETGDVIFTITLNGDGTFTYEQFGTIGDTGEVSFTDLTSSAAGNVDYRAVGEDDPATAVDLILSGSDSGGADQGVNTDSDSIGVDNQSMDVGETLRIDFVSNLETAPVAAGTPMGLTYDNHVDTNTYLQTIPQVQGSQTNEVAFQVWALDTSDTQADEPDRNPAGGFANSTIVTITSVTVIGFDVGEGTAVSLDISAIAVGVWTDVAYGISVQKQADGSVIFTGVQEGDQYGISTGASTFNSVAVQSEPEGTGPVGNQSNEDSFDLGVFSIGTDANIEPVDLTIPISLTDADGDPVVCDIDIHLGPPVNVDDITVTVNEAGLDLVGSDPGSDSEFFLNGDLSGQVSGGTPPYTFALAPGESATGTYGVLTLNADGTFSYELLTPFDSQPDADDGTNPELAADSFQVVATDDDGNTQTLTINVNIIDDVPTAVDDTDEVVEGESTSGNVLTGDGGDGNPAGEDTPGADGFATDAVVGVVTGDDDSVDTNNSATVGVVITGTYGELTLNEDGSYTYEAFADSDPPPGAVDEFVYTIMDGDGDLHSAVLTISVIDDLTPTLDVPTTGEAGTMVDEAGLPPRTGEPAGTGENADSLPNNESDDSEITSGTINFTPGDEPATVTIDGLGAGGPVTITAAGQVIEGRYGTMVIDSYDAGTGTITYTYTLNDNVDHDSQPDTDPFTVRVEDVDGDFVEETLTIDVIDDEPIAVDDTDSIPSGEYGPALGNVITDAEADGGEDNVGADDAVVVGVAAGDTNSNLENPVTVGAVIQGTYGKLTLNADGSYSYTRDPGTDGGVQDVFTYTIEDGDGDQTNATLTITIGDSTPDVPENTNVGLDDDALTGGNAGGTGDDPDSVNTSGSVASTTGDGPLTYALLETGAPLGFTYDLQGNGDLWVLQGTTHVLTVTLDQSGNYTVSQVAPIIHPDGSDENNVSFTVTFSATDQDGDFDEGTLTIDVDDDTPVNFTPVPLTDTPPLVAPTQDDALVNDGSANVIRLLNDPNNDGVGSNFIGADGFGSLYFTGTPADDGQALEDSGGTPLTSGSDPIFLFGFGTGVLTATTSADNSDPGAVVFTVTLTAGAGYGSASTYEIEFFQPIDDGSGFVFDDFSTAPAGQNDWIGLDADGNDIDVDNNDSEDLLLTPTNAGGSVNTSATDIGNSNQWIDTGEGIRLDYVVDVRRDPGSDEKDVGGYAFDGHYNVTDSSFTIMQTQGGGTAAVRITAYNDPDTAPLDTLSGSIVPIDPASIVVTGDATYTVTLLPDGSVVVSGLAAGASVEFETTGDVPFNSYSIQNASGMLNTATPAPGDTFTGDAFAVGVFGFNSETQGNPIDMSFDVTAEDADGDTSTGTIDVTLVPADSQALTTLAATSESSDPSSFSLLASDSQEQQVQKTAANSNTLTLAAAVAAAGLGESVAAHGGNNGDGPNNELASFAAPEVVENYSIADDGGDAAVSMLVDTSSVESAPADTSSSSSSNDQSSDNSLDDSSANAAPESNEAPAADDSGTDSSADAANPVAPTVAMVSAEALEAAANDNGNAQQGGSVEQIVAEALSHDNAADVDAVLANLPGGGNGALQALAHMASPDVASVSNWNTGGHGAVGAGLDMMFKMDVAMHHQDAVQPVQNG